MDNNERNREIRKEHEDPNMEAQRLKAEGKIRKNESTRKTNKLWIWLGVLILIFILVWWLWTIGIGEDISGVTNG